MFLGRLLRLGPEPAGLKTGERLGQIHLIHSLSHTQAHTHTEV